MIKSSLSLLVLVSVAVSTVSARAASVFTSQAGFISTLQPGYYTETFSNPAANPNAPLASKTITAAPFSYTIAGAASGLYEDSAIIGNWAPSQELVITFTAGNITAVGGEFFLSDVNGNFQSAPVTITMNDGTVETWTPSGVSSFRGFTSPGVTITSLTVGVAATRFNNIDNLIVGVAVPEPSGLLLVLGGLLPMFRRRR